MTVNELATLVLDLHRRITALEETNQALVRTNNDLVVLVEQHDAEIETLKDIISPRTFEMPPHEIGKAVAEMEESDPLHQFSRYNI